MTHKEFLLGAGTPEHPNQCDGEIEMILYARHDGRGEEVHRCARCGQQILLVETLAMRCQVPAEAEDGERDR